MGLEELFTSCICPWDNPQAEHTQLFYFIGASQLWEIEIYSAVQQTQELVTKHLEGNPINFVPPNKVKY